MKRKNFTLFLFAFVIGGPAMARHSRNSRNRKSRNKRGQGERGRNNKKITDSPIRYTGILTLDKGKLSISGNNMPIEVDRGMYFLIKKHVGKEVQITGTKITVDGKSKVRVKFIKPVSSTNKWINYVK